MELLSVLAIIAVLVAVAIPFFGGRLEKSRQAVCQYNRTALRRAYTVERMLDTDASNAQVMEKARASLSGSEAKGCPVAGSTYTYKFYTADGDASASTAKNGAQAEIFCNIEGHGNTTLQTYSRSIADWMASYSGEDYGNNVIDNFINEHGGTGIPLSDGELSELFGEGYDFSTTPEALYLKPLGATV